MVLLALKELDLDLGELRVWRDKLNELVKMLRLDVNCLEGVNNQILIEFLLQMT